MENLEKEILKCKWKESAEAQRENEIKRLGNDKGCESFYNFGCYKCDGYNKDCLAYYNKNK